MHALQYLQGQRAGHFLECAVRTLFETGYIRLHRGPELFIRICFPRPFYLRVLSADSYSHVRAPTS